MVSQKFTTQNADQTRKLGEWIGQELNGGETVALYGELGSGKTTFVQGLARGLGIKKRILSPTFVFIRQYKISPPRSPFQLRQGFAGRVGHLGGGEATTSTPARCNTFCHIDLYRIGKAKDIRGLGLEEIWQNPQNICVIEWAEKIKKILPKRRWEIYFKYAGENKREMKILLSRSVLVQGRTLLGLLRRNMNKELSKAIEILKKGGIVVFPTDTAFGVGCRIDDNSAVERLLKIKKRPKNQATPVLVDSIKMAQKYLLPISNEVLELMEKYWPGALTIVLPCKNELVFPLVRGGGRTLGVRWPDHPITQALIKGVGLPILGPSANFHGAKTPYKLSDLNPEFLKQVDLVIKEGKSRWGKPSTVIDCSHKPWKIIRRGALRLRSG